MGTLKLIPFLESVWALEQRVSALLVDYKLTLSQFRLLLLLKNGESQTAMRLSTALGITKATTTPLLQELVNADLIAIAPNPDDRRSILVRLSKAGEKRLREATEGMSALEQVLGRKLAPKMTVALNQLRLKETKLL